MARCRGPLGAICGCMLAALGCSDPGLPDPAPPALAALGAGEGPAAWTGSRLLPWGSGPGQAGVRPRSAGRLGEGVSAVAVGPDGGVYLLDRLNGRVLRAGAETVVAVTAVPTDAIDLAVGPDGAIAAYSAWRSRVWIYGPDGKLCGEMKVPREIRLVRGISLGPSRQVFLHTAYEETLRIGSAHAPLSLAEVLRSKRDGAFRLAGGAGVGVRLLDDLRPQLLVLGDGEKAPPLRAFVLPEPVLAARFVGVAGDTACLRLEKEAAGPTAGARTRGLHLSRSAICLDMVSGATILSRDLPPPGLYLPDRELAVGGAPGVLAFIHPGPDGLRVEAWSLDQAEGRADR